MQLQDRVLRAVGLIVDEEAEDAAADANADVDAPSGGSETADDE